VLEACCFQHSKSVFWIQLVFYTMISLFCWEILMLWLFRFHSGLKAPQLPGNSLKVISNWGTKLHGKFTKKFKYFYCFNRICLWHCYMHVSAKLFRDQRYHIINQLLIHETCTLTFIEQPFFIFWIHVSINDFTNSSHKSIFKILSSLEWNCSCTL